MVNEFHGTYPIRTISKGEQIIHMPKHVSGKFAIYVNEKADMIILRKEKPLNLKKLMKDLDKVVAEEEFVPIESAILEVQGSDRKTDGVNYALE